VRIDLAFSPLELSAFGDLSGRTVVVIDVLRATTTIAAALANGAAGIVPVASAEAAKSLAQSLASERPLLCGESQALKMPGFDLGNSPREMTREVVSGRLLVMATTNGTRTLSLVKDAQRVVTCAFTNLGAVVATLLREPTDVLVACAGREGIAALEDTVCAGYLIERLENGLDVEVQMGDAALLAQAASEPYDRVLDMLWRSEHGRFLVRQGLEADLPACAAMDTLAILPERSGDRLVIGEELAGSSPVTLPWGVVPGE